MTVESLYTLWDEVMNETASCMLFGWQHKKRWQKIIRPYSPDDVLRLRGSLKIEHTLSAVGSNHLWNLLDKCSNSSEIQSVEGAIQQVSNGSAFVHLSSDPNMINLVREVNETFRKADQIEPGRWRVPIVANIWAGFGGASISMFEFARELIEVGISGLCLDYGKKLKEKLIASRLAADVCGVPIVLIVRLDNRTMHDEFKRYCDFFWTTKKLANISSSLPAWLDKTYHQNVNEVLDRALS